jgi:hypothetical protein
MDGKGENETCGMDRSGWKEKPQSQENVTVCCIEKTRAPQQQKIIIIENLHTAYIMQLGMNSLIINIISTKIKSYTISG